MNLIVVTVPPGCQAGDQIAVDVDGRRAAKIDFPTWPFHPQQQTVPVPPPPSPNVAIPNTFSGITQAHHRTIHRSRQVINKRPMERILREREALVQKVIEHPRGININDLAASLYGKNYAKHERQYVNDDAVHLISKGLLTKYQDERGFLCYMPTQAQQ